MSEPSIIDPSALPMEEWEDKSQGTLSWRTLVSADRTESEQIVCGIAYFGPGEFLSEHRHTHPEVVHVVDGGGTATLGDQSAPLAPGTTVFVPSDMVHGFTAERDGLTLFYTFAASSFAEIEYRFPIPRAP